MKKKIRLIFHPVLVAVFPPMTLYLQNVGKLSFAEAAINLLAVFAVLALLWFVVSRWIRNTDKSAAVVSVFFMLFFSFGHVMPALANLLNRLFGVDPQVVVRLESPWGLAILLAVWALLFAAVVSLIVKSTSDFRTITQLLNVMSVVLALTTLYRYVNFASRQSAQQAESSELAYVEPLTATGARADDIVDEVAYKPDIYYIILDGYARADILQALYDWDNGAFLAALAQRGFYVADESHSNYGVTLFSFSSSLNLTYLDVVTAQLPQESFNPLPVYNMIQNNWMFHYMEELGYTTVSFATGYSSSEIKGTDVYLSPPMAFSAYQNELVNTTPLRLFLLKRQYDSHRNKILFTLDQLRTIPQDIPGPKLVFAHVVAPHPPFVLDAEGEPRYPRTKFVLNDGNHLTEWIGEDVYIQGYREQIAFISAEILTVLDDILTHSDSPPIIVLQADHGPGVSLDWESFENTYFPERFSILNAYYFPDGAYDALYPSITPVNTFRVILDQYFGTNYGLLEDRSYFSLMRTRPYVFEDITDRY